MSHQKSWQWLHTRFGPKGNSSWIGPQIDRLRIGLYNWRSRWGLFWNSGFWWIHANDDWLITFCIMVVQVVKFSSRGGGTKTKRFLPKNQCIQRDLSNFENRFDGQLSKIWHHFSYKVTVKTDVIKKAQ